MLGSQAAAGAAAIGGAVALLDCDSVVDVDWQKLRCLLYWERQYLYNALKGVHRLLALAALDYPYTRELALDADYQDLFPFLEPWESGKNLTKSKSRENFPSKCWDGALVTFNRPPTAANPGFETPQRVAYRMEAYPNFFVADDVVNPLTNGDLKSEAPVASASDGANFRSESVTAFVPVQFGNAVANAVDLFENLAKVFPNWNLDGDRGLAYLTWRFKENFDPDNVQVESEPS